MAISSKKAPLYKRLKAEVIGQIERKQLKPGDKLPSLRQLAEETGMSLAPIIRAIQELDEEGYIVRYQGKGSFVRARQHQAVSQQELALVVPGIDHNEMFAKQARRMQELGREKGFRELVLSSDSCENEADLVEEMLQSNVAGAVIYPPAIPRMAAALELLKEHAFPFVLLNWSLPTIIAHRVTSDDIKATYLLTRHMIELGHKHIAFISGERDYEYNDPRYVGYLRALLEYNLDVDPGMCFVFPKVIYDPMELILQGQRFAGEMLERSCITGVVANNPSVAAGVTKELRRQGKSVPEDMSLGVVSVMQSYMLFLDLPAVTAINMHEEDVIDDAVAVLLDQIEKGATPPTHKLLDCELIVGQTTSVPRCVQ